MKERECISIFLYSEYENSTRIFYILSSFLLDESKKSPGCLLTNNLDHSILSQIKDAYIIKKCLKCGTEHSNARYCPSGQECVCERLVYLCGKCGGNHYKGVKFRQHMKYAVYCHNCHGKVIVK